MYTTPKKTKAIPTLCDMQCQTTPGLNVEFKATLSPLTSSSSYCCDCSLSSLSEKHQSNSYNNHNPLCLGNNKNAHKIECPTCTFTLQYPSTLQCQHIYCLDCIVKQNATMLREIPLPSSIFCKCPSKIKFNSFKCAICREVSFENENGEIPAITSELTRIVHDDTIKHKCLYCPELFDLEKITEHMIVCASLQLLSCPSCEEKLESIIPENHNFTTSNKEYYSYESSLSSSSSSSSSISSAQRKLDKIWMYHVETTCKKIKCNQCHFVGTYKEWPLHFKQHRLEQRIYKMSDCFDDIKEKKQWKIWTESIFATMPIKRFRIQYNQILGSDEEEEEEEE